MLMSDIENRHFIRYNEPVRDGYSPMKSKNVSIACCLLLAILSSCSSDPRALTKDKILERPDDTNLAFWITQEASDDDFSECTFLPGMWGGNMYLDSKYEAVTITYEDGCKKIVELDVAVVYTITNYPDYSSKTSCVTAISITDPSIQVYGMTMSSHPDEVRHRMLGLGFMQTDEHRYSKNNCVLYFSEKTIGLNAKHTNIEGIHY